MLVLRELLGLLVHCLPTPKQMKWAAPASNEQYATWSEHRDALIDMLCRHMLAEVAEEAEELITVQTAVAIPIDLQHQLATLLPATTSPPSTPTSLQQRGWLQHVQ